MENLFQTEQDINNGIAAFEILITTEGWLLVEKIVNANIEVLKQNIINGVGEEKIEDVNRLRDRLKAYQDIIKTPHKMITQLKQEDEKEEVFDPYLT